MSKTNDDDLLRCLDTIAFETAQIRALIVADEGKTPTIIKARLHVYAADVGTGLGRHRQGIEDAKPQGSPEPPKEPKEPKAMRYARD